MRISDWSSDVCSSDLSDQYRIQQRTSWAVMHCVTRQPTLITPYLEKMINLLDKPVHDAVKRNITRILRDIDIPKAFHGQVADHCFRLLGDATRSEEHTSELQSLMRISYAVFCLKK